MVTLLMGLFLEKKIKKINFIKKNINKETDGFEH